MCFTAWDVTHAVCTRCLHYDVMLSVVLYCPFWLDESPGGNEWIREWMFDRSPCSLSPRPLGCLSAISGFPGFWQWNAHLALLPIWIRFGLASCFHAQHSPYVGNEWWQLVSVLVG